ncbi:hypothetical protein A9Q99_09020 [Gammaproteobacteria bacterium 45_16_T64]|nr:hypothetical protein A9Q99_09020 [Gammaproteobacteria bacterium 45_16_T64]
MSLLPMSPLLGEAGYDGAVSLVLIANDDVSIKRLSYEDLRAIYSLRRVRWPNGVAIHPLVLDVDGDLHRRFCREFLNVYPHQLKKGWDRMEYTGRATAPDQALNEDALVRMIRRTSGAIGYVSRDTVGESAHIISISE